jgi:pimeloyl-ACP methyl ester carboxylesterase
MRHTIKATLVAIAAIALAITASISQAQERIGVLMLHGKSPGSATGPIAVLKPKLEREGMAVLLPDMPWSSRRYIEGSWDKAMGEIAGHVKALREGGATKIVLIGHSMGVPAALSYAARKGDVQALVLLAPGHVPLLYYDNPRATFMRDSVDKARSLAGAGKGDSRESFTDINQGRQQVVVMTAKDYLSYFDPQSDAEMSVVAPRVPPATSSLVVVGDEDRIFSRARSYIFDRLPANPKSGYLEVKANHISTPRVASDAVVEWIKKAVAQ